eukprot:SAG31_NODE_77_length_27533_cov_47.448859_21_plen_158_part_00
MAKNNETALAYAVASQPVAVAIDASALQNYKSGVFSGCSTSPQLNHNVVVVGYSMAGAKPYWTVKKCARALVNCFETAHKKIELILSFAMLSVSCSSWGVSWGESGFIRLQMSKSEKRASSAGQCGLALFAAYPVGGGEPHLKVAEMSSDDESALKY